MDTKYSIVDHDRKSEKVEHVCTFLNETAAVKFNSLTGKVCPCMARAILPHALGIEPVILQHLRERPTARGQIRLRTCVTALDS